MRFGTKKIAPPNLKNEQVRFTFACVCDVTKNLHAHTTSRARENGHNLRVVRRNEAPEKRTHHDGSKIQSRRRPPLYRRGRQGSRPVHALLREIEAPDPQRDSHKHASVDVWLLCDHLQREPSLRADAHLVCVDVC